jgi:hypothetical protein
MWLAFLDDEQRERVLAVLRSAELQATKQIAFLEWLHCRADFNGNAAQLACHQLVQCQGFLNWSELRKMTDPVLLPHDCGVNCLFLLGRSERDAGIVKTMVGTLAGVYSEAGKDKWK